MKPTLLVLAAGMGSRYGGIKQIASVGIHDEILLDYAVYDAMNSGFGKAVFVIRKEIEQDFRERFFNRVARNFNAEYVFQTMDKFLNSQQLGLSKNRVKPWGTTHAVLCAADKINEPFAIINADDYYGRAAYKTMSTHLSTVQIDSSEYAMIAYILENTMSRSGSVSRGICGTADGYLSSIVENTKIFYEEKDGEEKIISELNGERQVLTGKEKVSMNLFGFTPKIFETLEQQFKDFVHKYADSEKKECLLPECAGEIIKTGKGRIKFYTTTERWFGMTYAEDREQVKSELEKKTKEGYYPEFLWR